ncbi:hypothetical protein ACSFBC_01785 [Variovorax sp. LT1R16]
MASSPLASSSLPALVTGAGSGSGIGTPADPFAAHVARTMHPAEPASDFAERVLQGLDQDAPFYWLTHPESRAWIDARHKTIEQNRPPFDDFGAPA